MRFLFVIFGFLISTVTTAQETTTKHQISFGENFSFKSSGSTGRAKTDKDLGIKSYDILDGNLSLNYLHSFAPQFQLGFSYSSKSDETKITANNGNKAKVQESQSSFYAIAIFNAIADIHNSWYFGGAIGRESFKEEVDSNLGDSEEEYDIDAYVAFVGKRFNLKRFGIENLTYSPMVTYVLGNVNGDLEDSGVEQITSVIFEFIKFDLLF